MDDTLPTPLFDGESAQVRDDAIPQEMFQSLLQIVPHLRWTYGWTTEDKLARYWHIGIVDGGKEGTQDQLGNLSRVKPAIFSEFLHWLRARLPNPEASLLRYYLNGHTFGNDGAPHTDSERERELTVVTYLTPDWSPVFGGETVVLDQQDDIVAAAMPRANRMMAFPAHWQHGPRPLARYYMGLRVTLVAKFALDPEGLAASGGSGS